MTDSVNINDKEKSLFVDYHTHVRYGETDNMRVAYYANYPVWFEAGRSEYGRQKGLLYSAFETSGYYLVVAELYCRYLVPLRFDDEIIVRTFIKSAGSRQIKFGYEVYKMPEMVLSAKGYSNHICVSKDGRTAILPGEWQKLRNKNNVSYETD
jgi:acyl-CoA thioester hydrolase